MCATYVLNRCPTKSLQILMLFEALNGRKPYMASLHKFEFLSYALVLEQHRKKLDDKTMNCIFVGYERKGCHFYCPITKVDSGESRCWVCGNVAHPLFSIKQYQNVSSQDILTFFNVGYFEIENMAQRNAKI